MQQKLSPEELASLSMAASRNSEALLEDARVLEGRGRFGRAHALATLALEEVGKHIICASAITRSAVEDDFWPNFWRRIHSHTSKLRQARLLIEAVFGDLADLNGFIKAWAQVESDHATKLRGLYVGWGSSGLEEPTDVSQDEAVTMIDLVSSITRTVGGVFNEQALVQVGRATQSLSAWTKELEPHQQAGVLAVLTAGLRAAVEADAEATSEADEAPSNEPLQGGEAGGPSTDDEAQ